VKIVLNATDTIAEVRTGAAASTTITQSVSTYYSFAAGEYIELRAFQNRGGNLDVTAAVKSSPEFWAYRRSA